MTSSEKELWQILRRLDGFPFRKQVAINTYVADFVCHRAKIIIELDGGIHDLPAVQVRDAERSAWLESRGFQVIRSRNNDVRSDPERVRLTVTHALQARLS